MERFDSAVIVWPDVYPPTACRAVLKLLVANSLVFSPRPPAPLRAGVKAQVKDPGAGDLGASLGSQGERPPPPATTTTPATHYPNPFSCGV